MTSQTRGTIICIETPLYFVGRQSHVRNILLVMFYCYQRTKWHGENIKLLNFVVNHIDRRHILTRYCTISYLWSLCNPGLHLDVVCVDHQLIEAYLRFIQENAMVTRHPAGCSVPC